MEGKMPLFHVPVSLGVQKTQLPLIHFCSSAPLQSQGKQRQVKIDLPPKVSEETRMAISHTQCSTCLHLYKCANTKENVCALCLCPCQMCTLIIFTGHVQAAHPFVLWHLIWPLPYLYVFPNCTCLFSDILRDRWGWVGTKASHRYSSREREREGEENERAFCYFCVKVGKLFLQYNSSDRQRHTNICFWAISENHSQPGSYLNIDECFSPLNKAISNIPKWTTTDGKRG